MSKVTVLNRWKFRMVIPTNEGLDVTKINPGDSATIDEVDVSENLKEMATRGRVRLTVVSEKRASSSPKKKLPSPAKSQGGRDSSSSNISEANE